MNRRTLLLAGLGLVVFALVGALLWYFMWRPLRYVDPVERFSMRFSPEWLVIGAGEGANVRAARELGGATGVINVFVSQIENIPDAKAFREWYMRLNAKHYSKLATVEEGERNGIPWSMFVYEIETQKDVKIRTQVMQYYFIRKPKGYIISCTALPSAFERFRPDFEEAVDSFQME
jgi:hypothetical protein